MSRFISLKFDEKRDGKKIVDGIKYAMKKLNQFSNTGEINEYSCNGYNPDFSTADLDPKKITKEDIEKATIKDERVSVQITFGNETGLYTKGFFKKEENYSKLYPHVTLRMNFSTKRNHKEIQIVSNYLSGVEWGRRIDGKKGEHPVYSWLDKNNETYERYENKIETFFDDIKKYVEIHSDDSKLNSITEENIIKAISMIGKIEIGQAAV